MNADIDLKKLWSKQKAEIPDVEELFKKANRFKKNHLFKLIGINILFLAISISIALIWFYYQPELLTTKIGIVLVIIAMLVYIAAYNTTVPLLVGSRSLNISVKAYLKQLLKLKEKQLFQQTKILNVYFILLSLGIILYLIEYVSKMDITFAILSYGVTLLWIAINWFYFRPKLIKKQRTKMNKLINEFKEIDKQLIT